jgi:hypothetical protein
MGPFGTGFAHTAKAILDKLDHFFLKKMLSILDVNVAVYFMIQEYEDCVLLNNQ